MFEFKKDQYRINRGGYSRVLDITCKNCGHHIAYYQKDGPGPLKRMYIDRFIDHVPTKQALICGYCDKVIGSMEIYAKENRPAYTLMADGVTKKVVSKMKVDSLATKT